MSALSIQVPFPVFQDRDGQPLDNGYVWIGTANLNPQTNPVVAYYDSALTIPAVQPLRTLNGYISNAGTPAQVYVDAVSFSILVQDSKGSMVYNFSDGTGISPNAAGIVYDPLTGPATTVQAELRALDLADTTFALKGANTDITSLASPALGDATATTQAAGDSTTKVATTAFVATAGGSQIQPISASLAASSLTISASALALNFRSTTLGSGTVTTVSGTPANLVVPSAATLGTINATQSILIVLALNNAGTLELAVVNIASGVNFSETGVVSTSAISAGATSASVIYSTTARTSVAYRVIGYIESTQATAGIWVTAPSTIQGAGGQASISLALNASGLAAMFAARAWVNFNGTGTVAIRASGNVSSITDNGTGNYTVNFLNSISDANYAISNSIGRDGTDTTSLIGIISASRSTTGFVIQVFNSSFSNVDCGSVNASIFR